MVGQCYKKSGALKEDDWKNGVGEDNASKLISGLYFSRQDKKPLKPLLIKKIFISFEWKVLK